MKTVYIASPYTIGDPAINVRRQIRAADKLLKHGIAPFVPLLSHFWHIISPKPYNVWLELDLEWILKCDYLLRLPGESEGADREVECARRNNIQVFYDISTLIDHVDGR